MYVCVYKHEFLGSYFINRHGIMPNLDGKQSDIFIMILKKINKYTHIYNYIV